MSTQRKILGERIFTRQSSRRFYLVRIRLVEAWSIIGYNSAKTQPIYLEITWVHLHVF